MAVVVLSDRAGRPARSLSLVEQALTDLDEDLHALSFHCAVAEDRLAALESELPTACPHRQTRELLARGVASARRRYRSIAAQLSALREQRRVGSQSRALVAAVSAQRTELADRLRVEQALLAALLAAPDWQSPAFAHSRVPAAGRQVGRVRAHWNDYKRDRHAEAERYERGYLERMVDGATELRALLTGCGMAAFTTILWWLATEGKLDGPVLAGAGLYHETRLLLERTLPGRVRFVDERDTAALLRAIQAATPSAVFLDTLSNTRWMPVPDLPAVIDSLRGSDTYLILDNTCLSVGCQPFVLAGESARLVVFESLLKYAQLGMDRVNAGVIVARSSDAAALDEWREHLGTNVGDLCVHALPRPDRAMLERRLARLQRNARHLAERLHECAPPGVAVVYPGVGAHHGPDGMSQATFRGGCLSVVLEGSARQARLVDAAVAEAARRGINLHAGSSFGFDTTRLYVTAAHARHGTPFVRIAAGTEHRLELEALTAALAGALQRCA